jgi:hypothetical protein
VNREKAQVFARAVREVANQVESGAINPGRKQLFCDSTPNCFLGHVFHKLDRRPRGAFVGFADFVGSEDVGRGTFTMDCETALQSVILCNDLLERSSVELVACARELAGLLEQATGV